MAAADFSIQKSNRDATRLILGSLFLGLVGIIVLQGAWVSVLICWLVLLIAAAGIVQGLRRVLEYRPLLVISAAGVRGSATQQQLIQWAQLKEARLHQAGEKVFLLLQLSDNWPKVPQTQIAGTSSRDKTKADGEFLLPLEQEQANTLQQTLLLQTIMAAPPEDRTAVASKALAALQHKVVHYKEQPQASVV